MSTPGIPQNLIGQTANQNNYISWDPLAGATGYGVYRSTDSVNYNLITTTGSTNYLDQVVTLGQQYFYKIAATGTPSAVATFVLVTNPVVGDTFSVNSVTFTAVASGATGTQFNINPSARSLTLINLVNSINSALVNTVSATVSDTLATFTAVAPGPQGNLIPISQGTLVGTLTAFSGGIIALYSPPSVPTPALIPAPIGEMALGSLRQAAQQKADRLGSQFVTTQEWNTFINLAMNELYDLLITSYEDYFIAPRAQFLASGTQSVFPLPNGKLTFLAPNGQTPFVASPFYKLMGVDLGIQNLPNNTFVTVKKYNLIDRNRWGYPNTPSVMYGTVNLQYRVMGNSIEFIPTPSGGQLLQLLYIPRLPLLVADTDLTTIGYGGWLEYVIVRAAKYALDKEESDTTKLDADLMFIQKRIEETAVNRDTGQPDTVSDTRQVNGWGSEGSWGSEGGWR